MDENVTKAKEIIANNSFMILSTTDGIKPWISPVFYATDDAFHFYWYSSKTSKHSTLLQSNSNVSIVIFNSTDAELPGLYMEGAAREVHKEELSHAMNVYFTKQPLTQTQKQGVLTKPEDFQEDSSLRMYIFIPSKFYINQAKQWNNKWLDSRVEVHLFNDK